jgi:O-antigen/teichoic acid export membrane protein
MRILSIVQKIKQVKGQQINMFGINKGFLWITGGQIVGLLNNFLLLKILTVNLSMSAYGYYALWMSIMLFIRQIIYDPISIILAKESVGKKFLGMDKACSFQIARHVTDRLLISLLLTGIFFIFVEVVFFKVISLGVYVLMGVIYLFSNGAQGIYLNILNTQKKRKWAAAGIAVDSFVKLCLVPFVFFIFENSLIFAVQAVAISSLLTFIWVRGISKKFYSPLVMTTNERLVATKQVMMLSLPLFAPTLLIALKGVGDKVFMASFIGVEELAAYNVLLQLGFIPMMLIVGVIQTYVSPDIYKLASGDSGDQKETVLYINRIILKLLIISAAAISASLLFSDILFKILVGVEYFIYAKFLPYFVMAGALAGMSGLLNVGVIGAFKPKIVGLLMFASVLAGLTILMISIVMYGFEGGIAGLVISNFVMVLIFGASILLIPFKRNE